jgi:hypothetical protein
MEFDYNYIVMLNRTTFKRPKVLRNLTLIMGLLVGCFVMLDHSSDKTYSILKNIPIITNIENQQADKTEEEELNKMDNLLNTALYIYRKFTK